MPKINRTRRNANRKKLEEKRAAVQRAENLAKELGSYKLAAKQKQNEKFPAGRVYFKKNLK